MQRYIRELKQYGLIKPVSGFKHRKGFEYLIADAEEYSRLTSGIDRHLQAVLSKLHKTKVYSNCDSTATVALVSQ